MCYRKCAAVQSSFPLSGPVVHTEKRARTGNHVGRKEYYRCCSAFHCECLSKQIWLEYNSEGMDRDYGIIITYSLKVRWTVHILIDYFQLLTTLLSLPFMKPRIPVSASASARPLDLSFLRLGTFWMLQAGNIMQSFGYFLPSTYLPTYSTGTVGLPEFMGTLLVSLFNATSIFGGIALGILCDRCNVTNVLLLSSVGSALSVLLFWGMASSADPGSHAGMALLTVFAISYGFFAGGFSSTWSGIITEVRDESSSSLETGLVFGLLAGGRGIGNVISGPLSTVLIRQGALGRDGATGYETQYGTLILFTGITAFLGAWGWMWRYMSPVVRYLH